MKYNDKNILSEYSGSEYVWSKTYLRIFKVAGKISLHNDIGDDNIPTIVVDFDGDLLNFMSLNAENIYEVIELPENFNYKNYIKNK